MKIPILCTFLLAVAVYLPLSTVSVQAGCAVASDRHGGYGYVYGDHSKEWLRREAIKRCARVSEYADDIHVIFETSATGSGVIMRYVVGDGREQIAAAGGCSSDHEARRKTQEYIEEHDGRRAVVVERWSD